MGTLSALKWLQPCTSPWQDRSWELWGSLGQAYPTPPRRRAQQSCGWWPGPTKCPGNITAMSQVQGQGRAEMWPWLWAGWGSPGDWAGLSCPRGRWRCGASGTMLWHCSLLTQKKSPYLFMCYDTFSCKPNLPWMSPIQVPLGLTVLSLPSRKE